MVQYIQYSIAEGKLLILYVNILYVYSRVLTAVVYNTNLWLSGIHIFNLLRMNDISLTQSNKASAWRTMEIMKGNACSCCIFTTSAWLIISQKYIANGNSIYYRYDDDLDDIDEEGIDSYADVSTIAMVSFFVLWMLKSEYMLN